MRRLLPIYIFLCILSTAPAVGAVAQCSICTRTAQQMGERPAKALNKGIVYLAFAPLAILGFVGFRWWRSQPSENGTSGDNR